MVNGAFFWFLVVGFFKGSLSTVLDEGKITLENSTNRLFRDETSAKSSFNKDKNVASLLHRASRELPQTKIDNEFLFDNAVETDGISEAVKKLPVKSKSFYVIPFFRPGRSDNMFTEKINFDTMIPMARFGRFVSDPTSSSLNSENGRSVTKKQETVIPTMRFGRNKGKKQSGYSNSVIPYPRVGRLLPSDGESYSTVNDGESLEDDYISVEEGDSKDENKIHSNSFISEMIKRSDDYETIIPYPRTGRQESNDADLLKKEYKQEDNEYVLSQFPYDRRSLVLLSPPNKEESTNKKPHTFVLPYPRPGRSSKYPEKDVYSKNLQVILPYPRPGRSELNFNEKSLNWDKRQNNYMLPFARLGRSAMRIPYENKDYLDRDDILQDLAISSYPVKSGQKNYEKSKEINTDLSSVFIIPYPRPGKKSLLAIAGSKGKPKQNNAGKEMSDYVLPYPRPGKKSSIQPSLKNYKKTEDESENARQFMVPYPRPGRSEENWFRKNAETEYQENESNDDNSMLMSTEKNLKNNDVQSKSTTTKVNKLTTSKKSKNTFMVPYAQHGSENVVRYGGLDENIGDEMDSGYDTYDYKHFMLEDDIDDFHDDGPSHLRYKRSNSVIPYPRIGRSDMIIPYPRLGRSDSIVPYPRPGRSNFVIPHPRLGRSNSIVPYPRPGRSDSVIPYPRLGRSNSVVPYPRPGRSNSVLPYPRLGRSNSLVPYPRPGRSDHVIPYPKLGRSDSVVPYPRPGRSDSIVPYPRPGRSESLVPLSRLNSLIPYPRAGRSNSILPYPRLGREVSATLLTRSRRSLTVVPYPRLGRSNKENNPTPNYGNWILPNIRPGRSESYGAKSDIIPYPRPGRNQNDVLQASDYDNEIIAKRLNGDLIIPYPRFGRTSTHDQGYVLPNPRFGRSQNSGKDLDEPTSYDTVIPYPRAGRSQEQATPSPDLHSSPHRLNKHMLTRVDDSIYILPYPRPGRYSA